MSASSSRCLQRTMASSCYYYCLKYLLVLITCLILLAGIGFVCVGLWVRTDPVLHQYVDDSDQFNFLFAGAYIIICIGVVISVVGALGCCGAVKNNICIIVTFFVALFVMFLTHVMLTTATIWAIVQKHTLLKAFGDALKMLLSKYYDDSASRKLMDSFQTNFHCCGADSGISDYVKYTHRTSHPEVCPLELFGRPCNKEIVNLIEDHVLILAAMFAIVALVMLLSMAVSLLLCFALRQDEISDPDNNTTTTANNGTCNHSNTQQLVDSKTQHDV